LEPRKIKRIVPALLKWYAANKRDLPWRRTSDPYAVFISEIMLQQTQVKTVIPYFERWLRELPDIASFARARAQKVLKLWEGLGYYSRVRNAQAAAQIILREHGGRFPRGYDEILALPGIGPYTAGAISSIAFNLPEPILDGNVIRVLTRVFGIEGDPKEKAINGALWERARQLVAADQSRCSELNQSLMELGALVCTPRAAKCPECPLRQDCFAARAGRVGDFPMLAKRAAATERRFVAFVVQKADRFLVRQRPAGVVNAQLWEFPNIEADLEKAPWEILETQPLCRVRHSITRYRILLEAYRAGPGDDSTGQWKTVAQLHRLPFTSAHRKILNVLVG
jgi:A/G-specific adenine glycosylase